MYKISICFTFYLAACFVVTNAQYYQRNQNQNQYYQQNQNQNSDCVCTLEYIPLCGSNGRNYVNRCQFNCDRYRFPGLTVVREGLCEDRPQQNYQQNAACICTSEYSPVCGTDGRTYGNRCQLNCEQNRYPGLSVMRNGACEERQPIQNQNSGCICPAVYDPVCGSNGKTYGNRCELSCDQNRMPGLLINRPGVCPTNNNNNNDNNQQSQNQNEACVCTFDYTPVCGSNGRTYSNRCALECEQRRNPGLRVLRNGQCGGSGSRFPSYNGY